MLDRLSKTNEVNSYLDFQTRDKEILDWVKQHSSENFIMIDDNKSLRNLPIELKQYWIETQFLTGFDKICLTKAFDIIAQNFN